MVNACNSFFLYTDGVQMRWKNPEMDQKSRQRDGVWQESADKCPQIELAGRGERIGVFLDALSGTKDQTVARFCQRGQGLCCRD